MSGQLATIASICFALGAVGLIVTVMLFIMLNIREVIGELSGKTATETIARLRAQGGFKPHRGRSLQSILDGKEAESAPFEIEDFNVASYDEENKDAKEASPDAVASGKTSLTQTSKDLEKDNAERRTELLGDVTEQQTSLLDDAAEQQTSLLNDVTEQQTSLLNDATEQQTSLLSECAGAINRDVKEIGR
jgi:hypothetical protein